MKSKFVAATVNYTRFVSAPCHPDCKGSWMVIATVSVDVVDVALNKGGSSEFAAPDGERVVQLPIANPRRTIHLGYHSDLHRPSWHFYLLDADKIDDQFLDGVSSELKDMMIRYRDCRQRYPRMEDTWTRSWATKEKL